ncbi:MAG: hypothetical protein JNK49_03185 [Planctomycetes bacterium]|nr:hypothetical protein [Planctomycetota bacterium]
MTRSPFDDLAHRVANLLGTIQLQVEVARLDGSLAAHQQALQSIEVSAQRTLHELRALQAVQRPPAEPPGS